VPANILGISLTAFMTFLLICSSLTMVKALDAIKKGDKSEFQKFLSLTILGGLIFLSLQAYEWNNLINHDNLGLSQNPFGAPLFGATFYMITGFHGMHVTGGVIYLSCVFAAVHKRKYAGDCYNLVENVGLYWHFVDLVWILVFTFVYLL
jgi:heme/copper-type cytochrome/quinol oxidase subunit 3